jgi:NADH-quinone oxidoreductase subunit A
MWGAPTRVCQIAAPSPQKIDKGIQNRVENLFAFRLWNSAGGIRRVRLQLWPLGLYFILVIGLVVVMLLLSHLLGQRHNERETGQPYEGGIVSEGSAHVRFSMKFYLTAVFFVIFDLEAVFLFSWAVVGRELGWAGYGEVLIFIAILIASLAYLWRLGALDWNVRARQS